VTPVHLDLTDYRTMNVLKEWRLDEILERAKKGVGDRASSELPDNRGGTS
jgi:hypothetical protein